MLRLNVRVVAVLFFGAEMPERRPLRIGEIFSMASGEASIGRREVVRGEGTQQQSERMRR